MKKFEIEKNVPMPTGRGGKTPIYQFDELNVTDSFFVSADGRDIYSLRNSINGCIRNFKSHEGNSERVFTTAIDRINNGIRVWRIK